MRFTWEIFESIQPYESDSHMKIAVLSHTACCHWKHVIEKGEGHAMIIG